MNQFNPDFDSIPELGVGLSHRNEIIEKILANRDRIDFLEVIAARFNNGSKQHLSKTLERFPLVLHELELSLGTDQILAVEDIAQLSARAKEFKAHWVSDHLCMTKIDNYDLEHLTPIVYSDYLLNVISNKVKRIVSATQVPFLIENITYFFQIPGSEMDECTFLNRLFDRSGCFMLLDINNLFVNAQNFNFDPYEYIGKISPNKIVEIHLGGSVHENGIWIDSHGHPVPSAVWDLLEFVVERHAIKAVILERDQNIVDFDEILTELEIAKSICKFKSTRL